jgi:chemotaxis protein MotB
MASHKNKHGGGGGHGGSWVISFADLMSLLMAFFVMLLSFSVQDQERLNVAAGSVQHAFGIQPSIKLSGMVERQGNPERDYRKRMAPEPTQVSTDYANIDHDQAEAQGTEAQTSARSATDPARSALFATAAASLKQAWREAPELTSIAASLIVNETREGLDIVIADQTGRPMFPEGSKYPYEITRKAIAAIAPVLAAMPNPIRISGHVAAGGIYANERYGPWELSSDRANVVRAILGEFGLADARVESVAGRGQNDPFFPNDPYLSANQRVSILLVYEQPPVPAMLAP